MTTEAKTQPKEFNKFQAFLWPIHNYELKKFLPMSFLMFFILLVYTLVRDLKDIFVNYRTHMWIDHNTGLPSAETSQLIPALKLWYVLPCAFLAVMAFTFLMNKFGSKKTFYIIISFFMVFYAIFGFILYPNLEALEMSSEAITSMVDAVPALSGFIACFANWPVALFYIFSEIWGTMAIASLFWQFANATTMKTEVKRFFGLFSLIGNIGVVIAGELVQRFIKDKSLPVPVIAGFMVGVIICGLTTMGIYYYINAKVLTDPRFFDPTQIKKKKKKEKVSVTEGIKLLFSNTYLLLIAVLVLGYGVAINFAEIVLKDQMKEAFDAAGYAHMQGNVSKFTGVFTIFVTLFGAIILRKCKWRTTAVITPLIFLILGGAFFMLVMYKKYVSPEIMGISSLTLAVWFGVIQDALTKSVKYSLFDTTKSMAYIPLDEDTKTKGQAAVEVIGGRAGKAGASAIQQVMFAFQRGIMNHLITVVVLFVATVVAWIFSVFKLSSKYEKAIAEQNEEELA